MITITGYLEFPPELRHEALAALAEVTTRSRLDPGCLDYWWAEDLEHPDRFRFFEAWESAELFAAHRDQPYEHEFMELHVSRVTGADAQQYESTPVPLG